MRSRTHSDDDPSTGSTTYNVSEAENMILPDGAVQLETAELLGDLIVHGQEETLVSPEDVHRAKIVLPWWKKPSPFWLICLTPLTAIAMAATLAPRVEIYTMLACREYRPEIFETISHMALGSHIPWFPIVSGISPVSGSARWTTALHAEGIATNGTRQPNLCASDPVVQAAVAKLTVVVIACIILCGWSWLTIFIAIATLTGVLSCLTTGWWGALSDRHGRTRVLGISVIGVLVNDLNFIFVTMASQKIPGGYWALLLGPLIDGSVGGVTAAAAAMHAYMADTTTESTRSRYLSLTLGLMFTGLGIGPTFGALLIRVTGRTLSVFYAATLMHLIYAVTIWFFLPESLTVSKMRQSLAKYRTDISDTARNREATPAAGLFVRLRRLFAFLSPLTIFTPGLGGEAGNPLKRKKRDWNLTLLAIGYAFNLTIMGSYSYKFQYAASTFKWNSETIGYWISLLGIVRAIFLTMLLPTAIKLIKPAPITIELPLSPTETQPLLGNTSRSDEASLSRTRTKVIHSPIFDLNLARASLFVDIISYWFMSFASTPLQFTLSTMFSSFGSGFSPAAQSVSLAMYARRGGSETGRLFGGLSVIQALCAQILGPALYGIVYMKTVASFPRAILFFSVGTAVIAFILFSFVRIPDELAEHHMGPRERSGQDEEEPQIELARDATLVNLDPNESTVDR